MADLFLHVHPFVRFAHIVSFEKNSGQGFVVPYEARLFYCRDGCGFLDVESRTYEMTRGAAVIIPPGTGYHLFCEDEPMTFFALNFDYTLEDSLNEMPIAPSKTGSSRFKKREITFSDAPELSSVLFCNCAEGIGAELEGIVAAYNTKLLFFRSEMSAALLSVLTKILRACRSRDNNEKSFVADDIIRYIQEHFSEQLNNTAIANVFHFHPGYVSRIVKKCTGMPLHQYVLHIRIFRACDMLMSGAVSIEDTARACGFYDISHFSKYFKAVTGKCPRDFFEQRNKR